MSDLWVYHIGDTHSLKGTSHRWHTSDQREGHIDDIHQIKGHLTEVTSTDQW